MPLIRGAHAVQVQRVPRRPAGATAPARPADRRPRTELRASPRPARSVRLRPAAFQHRARSGRRGRPAGLLRQPPLGAAAGRPPPLPGSGRAARRGRRGGLRPLPHRTRRGARRRGLPGAGARRGTRRPPRAGRRARRVRVEVRTCLRHLPRRCAARRAPRPGTGRHPGEAGPRPRPGAGGGGGRDAATRPGPHHRSGIESVTAYRPGRKAPVQRTGLGPGARRQTAVCRATPCTRLPPCGRPPGDDGSSTTRPSPSVPVWLPL